VAWFLVWRTTRITITLQDDQVRAIREFVAAGKASSVSAFVQHAVGIALFDAAGWQTMLHDAAAANRRGAYKRGVRLGGWPSESAGKPSTGKENVRQGQHGQKQGGMSGITFDAGGLIALDRNDRRVIALLARAADLGMRVSIPATALGQAIRNPARQARLSRLIRQASTDLVPLNGPKLQRQILSTLTW
jgi:Arc/MetJ-type ribon-helix-helix transcriptional regulator